MRLTAEGEHKYDAVTERYAQWAEMLIAGMTAEDLGQTLGVVNELEERLDRTPAPQ
jgi:DNA-binding MarR family transcriptional regulator